MKASAGSVAPLALLILCTVGPRVMGTDLAEATVKNGSCPLPPSYTDSRAVNTTEKLCSTDQQCPREEKCCNYGCGFRCRKPLQVKEGSCPSFDRSICIYVRPLPDACQNDTQCPGTERCCCHNCRSVCTATVKPGTCPHAVASCKLPLHGPKCQFDADCQGPQKCCSLCGNRCMDPEKENPGRCPVDPEIEKQCGYLPPPKCNRDAECGAGEKCCLFGCGVQCVKALPDTDHQGACPNILAKCKLPLPPPQCQTDKGCPKSQKCCELCGKKCLDAEQDHTGFCPAYKPVFCDARYISDCSHDSGCKADEKCCKVGCRQTCVKSKKEKPGVCPFIPMDELSEDMCNKCNEDKDCPQNEKCCAGGKGRECRKPNQEIAVKSGECPRRISWCDYGPPYNHKCSNDGDCPGEQKCCIEICNQECKDPVPVKTGECPKDTVVCKRADPDQCKSDSNCTGDQKCCYFHCGLKCKDPAAEKPGECPVPVTRCKTPLPPPKCSQDSDCPGSQKCCTPVCTQECTNITTVPTKPGLCPSPPSYPTCATFPSRPMNTCSTDQQCPGDEKCCEYGCKLQCKKPLQDKLGSCPAFNRSICIFARPAPAECSSDRQCPGTQRCCFHGACRMECAETVKPKQGKCPKDTIMCIQREKDLCKNDGDCTGDLKCCYFQCGLKCKDPETGLRIPDDALGS